MVSDPIKILIVDDDEQVLIELERLLESGGYSTTAAWCEPEALAFADQVQFDVLLADEDRAHPGGTALRENRGSSLAPASCRCISAETTRALRRYTRGSTPR